MSNMVPPRYHQNDDPRRRHPFLSNWTVGDIVVFMMSITGTFVLFQRLNWFPALLLTLVLVALNRRWEYGRGWYEVVSMLRDIYIFVFLKDTLYLDFEQDESNAFVRFFRQKRYRRPRHRFVYPIRHTIVEAQGSRYGVIQQLDRPYDHIPVRGRGSDFTSMEPNRKHDVSNNLAYNVDQVAAQAAQLGLKMGISYVHLSRPANSSKTDSYFVMNGQPLVFDTEQFDVDPKTAATMTRLRKNADEISATQRAKGASESWQLAMATIKRTRGMEQAVKNKLDDTRLYDLPLIELGRQLVEAVQGSGMNVRDVHCLSYMELCQLIRGSYDVTDLSFHRGQFGDQIQVVDEEDVADPTSPYESRDLGTLKDPFPVAPHKSIVVGADFICIDGNWMSSFYVSRRLEMFHVTDVQRVYHRSTPRGVWSSTVTAGETISSSMDTNILVFQQRFGGQMEQAFFQRVVEHPNTKKRRQQLSQQAEMMSSQSLAQQFNDVVCVVASTEDKMRKDRAKVLSTFRTNGYKCRIVKGRSRQLDAAITATLGVNRL